MRRLEAAPRHANKDRTSIRPAMASSGRCHRQGRPDPVVHTLHEGTIVFRKPGEKLITDVSPIRHVCPEMGQSRLGTCRWSWKTGTAPSEYLVANGTFPAVHLTRRKSRYRGAISTPTASTPTPSCPNFCGARQGLYFRDNLGHNRNLIFKNRTPGGVGGCGHESWPDGTWPSSPAADTRAYCTANSERLIH